MASEYKAIKHLEQVVLIRVSPYDTHEYPCFNLSIFKVCFVVFIDFDGDRAAILLHVQTHKHLAEGSSAKALLNLVTIAELFANVCDVQAVLRLDIRDLVHTIAANSIDSLKV